MDIPKAALAVIAKNETLTKLAAEYTKKIFRVFLGFKVREGKLRPLRSFLSKCVFVSALPNNLWIQMCCPDSSGNAFVDDLVYFLIPAINFVCKHYVPIEDVLPKGEFDVDYEVFLKSWRQFRKKYFYILKAIFLELYLLQDIWLSEKGLPDGQLLKASTDLAKILNQFIDLLPAKLADDFRICEIKLRELCSDIKWRNPLLQLIGLV